MVVVLNERKKLNLYKLEDKGSFVDNRQQRKVGESQRPKNGAQSLDIYYLRREKEMRLDEIVDDVFDSGEKLLVIYFG